MKKNISYVLILQFVFVFYQCSKRSIDPQPISDRVVTRYGSEDSFDIATWNIETFPKDGPNTVRNLYKIIRDIDVDLIGVQEINSISAFNQLLDSLQGYDGFVSSLPGDFLKLGIIYKRDFISISTPFQIFTNDNYAFPRPPLVSYVQVKKQNATVFDFTLIVLHLKAFDDPDSRERRRDACVKLKEYIDSTLLPSQDPDVIILGDLNDEIDDPPNENVFQIFLDDTADYRFITEPLTGQGTYIGSFDSFIDHIFITADTDEEYAGGLTHILKLDQEFSGYTTIISDHRPVLAHFFVF